MNRKLHIRVSRLMQASLSTYSFSVKLRLNWTHLKSMDIGYAKHIEAEEKYF